MTTFRKLAASSPAAIVRSLKKRRKRIASGLSSTEVIEIIDSRFEGEWDEKRLETIFGAFFEGEAEMLDALIEKGVALIEDDIKMKIFLEQVIDPISAATPQKKILIFTEYLATQACIVKALRSRFSEDSVAVINCTLGVEGKGAAVRMFNTHALFLVSTEAGGEGLNLHHRCHHVVNYDLPWNPMRIVQRVGRVYRYGQPNRVIVFNMHSPDSLDGHIIRIMYERIATIVRDLSELGEEFNENLYQEIFGQIVALSDLEYVLKTAFNAPLERTQARIDDALQRARASREKQEAIFREAQQFNAEELAHEMTVGVRHLRAFIEAVLPLLGCEIIRTKHQGNTWDIRLSEYVRERLDRRAARTTVTIHRAIQCKSSDVEMMDFGNDLFRCLIEEAQSHRFGGLSAALKGTGESKGLIALKIRWQNDLAILVREELLMVRIDSENQPFCNDTMTSDWLCERSQNGHKQSDPRARQELLSIAEALGNKRLEDLCNSHMHPAQMRKVSAAHFTTE